MRCCANCFGNRDLKEIISKRSTESGDCSYCESAGVQLVEPKQLANYFNLLVAIYEPDQAGRPLVEWLRDDWCLFKYEQLDISGAENLVGDILEDHEIVQQLVSPSARYQSDALAKWDQLREELMHKNRYFPVSQMDLAWLAILFDLLRAIDMPAIWYRARVQSGDVIFSLQEMGAPSNRLASHGRANPSGIPYLYLSSSPTAAVSEIRPHVGELACVASFQIPAGLKFVDLRNPRQLVSPFLLEDESKMGLLRVDIAFLERLGDELTRPIIPQAAAIDYVPSQYLCEYIKKCGYDGVIYRSSVSTGINLALFDPNKATAQSVTQHKVTRVSVDLEAIPT